MAKQATIVKEGEVIESLSNARFRVRLDNGLIVMAQVSGKMRIRYIKIVTGDLVKVEFSPYNLTLGRRIVREKRSEAGKYVHL